VYVIGAGEQGGDDEGSRVAEEQAQIPNVAFFALGLL